MLHMCEPNLQTAILCLWERLNAPLTDSTDTSIPVNIQMGLLVFSYDTVSSTYMIQASSGQQKMLNSSFGSS